VGMTDRLSPSLSPIHLCLRYLAQSLTNKFGTVNLWTDEFMDTFVQNVTGKLELVNRSR